MRGAPLRSAPCFPEPFPLSQDYLEIRGARVHNLKNIDARLPHNRLIVVTGVSGSGKSSLVFDTVYAEGRRRYVESLSAYARQFLERMEKPDVEAIAGIAPPVAIRRKNAARNPRSTVATTAEIYDFLRLLFARVGKTHCPGCGKPVSRDTPGGIAAQILALEEGSRWYALFPVGAALLPERATEPSGELKERLAELRSRGYNRLFQNGAVFEFSTPESLLDIDFGKPFFVLVDRLKVSSNMRERVVDAAEIAFRESGEVLFESAAAKNSAPPRRLRFSEKFECRDCGIACPQPEPRLFSFNSPFGACPRCQGFGNAVDYDMRLVIPDRRKTLAAGAVEPWTKPRQRDFQNKLLAAAPAAGVRVNTPYGDLAPEERAFVEFGADGFGGVKGFFAWLETKKHKMSVRLLLAQYRGYTLCPDCGGSRLRSEARNVRIAGKTIADVAAFSLGRALEFFDALELQGEAVKIGSRLLLDIRRRLQFLNDVGLEYLTLDRLASTLSGGEAQRIQLASSLGSRLVGACYVLDEPSIGLHPRDTRRLIGTLHELRDIGNTILVVEHDPDIMRAADHILDLGPAAGEKGGQVVFNGTAPQILADRQSLTGKYLSARKKIPVPAGRRKPRGALRFEGADKHNLQNLDVSLPLGVFTVVTGVSGSGKSTLVNEIVRKGLECVLKPDGAERRLPCRGIAGFGKIDDVVCVDQSPIGRSPRSNPVTYVKAFDAVRELFASTSEAGRRGYPPGYFSFNVPGGRCETCQGDGSVTVEMQFLSDVELVCEDCKGKRYRPEILEIQYRGKNIHDVLRLTVDEALRFFADHKGIRGKLAPLARVGLGYLRLGQSATTLSGGEAQRVKLAAHIGQSVSPARAGAGRKTAARRSKTALYLFDEPTTGLHFEDIAKLLEAFERLLDKGGTVLVIEHNLDVIKSADWVIDLGPEGGAGGGAIVAEGPPEAVAAAENSHTGKFLKAVLA